LTLASKLISFKITLFDPDLLLLKMSKKLRFLWSPGALALLTAMLAGSAWLLIANSASLSERTPDLLAWQNLAILWLVMILVKIVHEFGHGLACKHFGGEVHEMGAMFILFSPFLFCDASDSWTFREKRKRLMVNFGGIYLELFLASTAAALWVVTQPGFFNQVFFNVMLVCSVMTVFFNANPLMKFDGYYALSDWLEMPNLKERGDRTLISRTAGMLTAGKGVVKDPLVESMKGVVICYAVASYLWTFTVAYRMLIAIGNMLEPYGLDRLAQATSSLVLLTGVFAPPIMIGLHVRRVLVTEKGSGLWHTVVKRTLLASGLLALILALPLPTNVRSTCVIEAANRARITAATAGYIREVACTDGQSVTVNDILAQLENPELESQVQDYEFLLASQQAALAAAESDPEYRDQLVGLQMQAAQLKTALEQAKNDQAQLTLRSPVSGIVLGRSLQETKGMLLRRGALFCEVLPAGPMEAAVVLQENEAGSVEQGQRVRFRLNSLPSVTFKGKVIEVTEQPVSRLPHQSLGEYAGGTVPGVMSAGAPRAGSPPVPESVPVGQVFQARLAIDNQDGLLRPGMSGRVRIDCGKKILALSIWNWFTGMLRTDFRL
jgi:putative peptide zinc metalloprotease protein